jgi:hypothetical protein
MEVMKCPIIVLITFNWTVVNMASEHKMNVLLVKNKASSISSNDDCCSLFVYQLDSYGLKDHLTGHFIFSVGNIL